MFSLFFTFRVFTGIAEITGVNLRINGFVMRIIDVRVHFLGVMAAGEILSYSFTRNVIFHIMNKCMENTVIKGCE